MNQYVEDVITIITNTVPLTKILTCRDLDTNLQDIGMDSISFVSIVVTLEDYFSFTFPEERIVITKMNTIRKFCEEINAQLAGRMNEEAKQSENE